MIEADETKVYRAFARAFGDRIREESAEISDLARAERVVSDFEEKGCALSDSAADLAMMKERFALAWDMGDPAQAAASAEFPDEERFDAERCLRLICARFDIDYEHKEEVYASLLQAILDEQGAAQKVRGEIDRLKAECASAEAKASAAKAREQRAKALLESATAQIGGYAGDALKIQLAGDESAEEIVAKMRAAQTAMPATSGYCDAILRTIARKCDVENAGALTREELVQQITDTLDTRLIPKGMRLRKVGTR